MQIKINYAVQMLTCLRKSGEWVSGKQWKECAWKAVYRKREEEGERNEKNLPVRQFNICEFAAAARQQ